MALSLIRSRRASFDSCATFAARLNQCEDCKKEAISVSSLLKTKALKRIMFWQSSTLSAAHRETCPCVSIWTNTMASCAPSTTQDHTYSTISYGATLAQEISPSERDPTESQSTRRVHCFSVQRASHSFVKSSLGSK